MYCLDKGIQESRTPAPWTRLPHKNCGCGLRAHAWLERNQRWPFQGRDDGDHKPSKFVHTLLSCRNYSYSSFVTSCLNVSVVSPERHLPAAFLSSPGDLVRSLNQPQHARQITIYALGRFHKDGRRCKGQDDIWRHCDPGLTAAYPLACLGRMGRLQEDSRAPRADCGQRKRYS